MEEEGRVRMLEEMVGGKMEAARIVLDRIERGYPLQA